jgi:acetylornithine/N-succinyldiaminopimelate aminotransferase|uniref:acetylornithine transaminase n=1 Tax=Candidatus Planktophila sp. TaxID=2175601 RepID=UPI00404A6337
MSKKSLSLSWTDLMMANYGTPSRTFVSGKGCVIKDDHGNSYLDFLAGIATNVLGHAHPAIVKSVSTQVATLGHVSNFFAHPQGLLLASRLQAMTGDSNSRVFFCNSGAEANEAALKISRRTGRSKIVAAQGSFHGRTMGALSMTGQPAKREPFTPLLKGVTHVPFGDLTAMRRAVTKRTAMVIVEPIMGEAGVITPPDGYLAGLRHICDQTGALLVFDCVQTGIGRTGQWFGFEHEKVKPDVLTLAKGLGGGLPIGATIAYGSAAQLLQPGDHGTTFGGSPISCAAGNAVLDVIVKNKLMQSARSHEKKIKSKLTSVSGVKEVRGRGLLLGIELESPIAKSVAAALLDSGVIVNAANESTIRIAPPLIVTALQIEKFISLFTKVLKEVHHG